MVFATNVCVSVGGKPRHGDNNVRFKLWPNGTPKVAKERGLQLVKAIDKEYDNDIARSLVLWWPPDTPPRTLAIHMPNGWRL